MRRKIFIFFSFKKKKRDDPRQGVARCRVPCPSRILSNASTKCFRFEKANVLQVTYNIEKKHFLLTPVYL